MWGTFGGLVSNLGAWSWIVSKKDKLPTLLRDLGGILMDFEQINMGHYKAGKKNYFFSGVSLIIGTGFDLIGKFVPAFREISTPLTFMADGFGRYLLRLHQNEFEDQNNKPKEIKLESEQELDD